jgi:molybdenum cofactor cytidylyltransferase
LIAAIVLAAGTSARLGLPKQLLELDNRPLLQHVVDAVEGSSVDEIVIVLGHEAKLIKKSLSLPARARVAVNPSFAEGQATSMRCGLDAVNPEAEAAVFVLGDQPRVTSQIIDVVIGVWRESAESVARAYFNGTPGHPVVVARSSWDAFRTARGDVGGRQPMDAGAVEVAHVEVGVDPLEDVDTWRDYERLRHGH